VQFSWTELALCHFHLLSCTLAERVGDVELGGVGVKWPEENIISSVKAASRLTTHLAPGKLRHSESHDPQPEIDRKAGRRKHHITKLDDNDLDTMLHCGTMH